MQSAEFADGFDSGTQVQVIGIGEEDLDSEFLKNILRNAFDRGCRAHRHEYRGFDLPVRGDQAAGARDAGAGLDLELDGHSLRIRPAIVATVQKPMSETAKHPI